MAWWNRQPTQSCLNIHHYLGIHHWNALSNFNPCGRSKVELLYELCMDLGLTHPSTATMTHMVTMSILCDSERYYTLNQYFIRYEAQELRSRLNETQELRPRPLPHEGVVINYPNNAAELLAANSIVYNHFYKVGTEQEFTPAPCPINETTLAALRQLWMARASDTEDAQDTEDDWIRTRLESSLYQEDAEDTEDDDTEDDWIPLYIKKMPNKKMLKKKQHGIPKKVPKKDMLLQKDPVRMVWPRPVNVRWKQMPTKTLEDQTDLDELTKLGLKKWLVKRAHKASWNNQQVMMVTQRSMTHGSGFFGMT